MSKRKLLLSALVLIFCSTMMFAAGNQDSKSSDETITLKFWRHGTQTVWTDYTKEFIKRYEAKNPNIKIEYEYYPPFDTFQRLNVAFTAGVGPDIVGVSLNHVALYAEKKQFMALDDYINSWPAKDDLMESMLAASELKGKHYAVAYHPDPYVFAYRKDYFREAGLDPEDPPDTWEKLAEIAPKLTIRDGDLVTRAGYLLPIDDYLSMVPFAVMLGAEFISSGTNPQPTFNQKPWVDALTFMTKMFKDEKVSLETIMKSEWSSSTFAKGNAAIAQVNSTMLSILTKSNPDAEIGYFQLKAKENGPTSNWNGAWLLSINENSQHKDESWAFIEEWMSSENMWKMYQATGNLPPLKSLKEKFVESAVDLELNNALFAAIGTGLGNPLVPWSGLQSVYVNQAMAQAYYGEKTPEAALNDNYNLLMEEIKKANY